MIAQHALAILWLLLVGLTYARLLKHVESPGSRYHTLVIVSGSCLTVAALLFWLSAFSDYPVWFVPNVYQVLDWVRNSFVFLGCALAFWAFIQRIESDQQSMPHSRAESRLSSLTNDTVENWEGDDAKAYPPRGLSSLNALNTLRVSLSRPSPFVELAQVALASVSEFAEMQCGALYVYNESTEEMTIAASLSLSAEQERVFERLPMRAAVLVEVFAGGEPLMSSEFVATTGDAKLKTEQYPGKYALLVPVMRNTEALGLLVLFGVTAPRFSNSQLGTLTQMSDIIADKFANVKVRGELARANRKSSAREDSRQRLAKHFQSAFDVTSNSTLPVDVDLDGVCQELIGLGASDAVALVECDAESSSIRFCASSSAFPKLSGGFERALLQALDKGTLVLLSRERKSSSESNPHVNDREPMALVAPLVSNRDQLTQSVSRTICGLLFWNSSGRFHLSTDELQEFQAWLLPLTVVLQSILNARRSQGALRMFEIVRQFLHSEKELTADEDEIKRFVSLVHKTYDFSATSIIFKRAESGQLKALDSFGVAFEAVSSLVILPGEGSLGKCAALGVTALEQGAARVAECCREYDMLNREFFGAGFERMGDVQAQLVVPISVNGAVRFVLSFFSSDAERSEEVSRVILPLSNLVSLVLSVRELRSDQVGALHSTPRATGQNGTTVEVINEVNNDLLTIIGNCQLAADDPNMVGAVDSLLRLVIDRAEHSAEILKARHSPTTIGEIKQEVTTAIADEHEAAGLRGHSVSLVEKLREFASQNVVGGRILLTEGKAREVEFDLEGDFALRLTTSQAKLLVEQLCHGFCALADEEEIVTVSGYGDAGYEYLDITRRWRNLPATERIGSYARFGATLDGVFDISTEMLRNLSGLGVEIALDRRSERPSYVTLRIHSGARFQEPALGLVEKVNEPRILAIDDQTMILDLLSAMCDSQGFEIDTFDSPARAIAAFERGQHEIVISDVAMPNMDGWEVASAIKKLRPETYLIFITGWEEGLSEERLRSYDVNHVLKKPFRLEQLTDALEEARRLTQPAITL